MKRTNLTQWLKWIMGLDYSPAPVPVRVPMRTGLRLDQLDERRLPHATPLACPFDTAQQAPTETDTTTDSATADSATATDSSLAPRAFDFRPWNPSDRFGRAMMFSFQGPPFELSFGFAGFSGFAGFGAFGGMPWGQMPEESADFATEATHFDVQLIADAYTGEESKIAVVALDEFNQPVPGYTGTVHFTSSDPSAVLPADYTFTAADRGVHVFPITATNVGALTITVTETTTDTTTDEPTTTDDTSTVSDPTAIVTEPTTPTPDTIVDVVDTTTTTPTDDSTAPVSDTTDNAVVEEPTTVDTTTTDDPTTTDNTTTVVDDPATDVTDVVDDATDVTDDTSTDTTPTDATPTDPGADTPTDATPTDPGADTPTDATPTDPVVAVPTTPAIVAGSITFDVTTAPVATHFDIRSFRNVLADEPTRFMVVALDARNRPVTNYNGTIHLSSTDATATLPADFTFTDADRGMHVFSGEFDTTGIQTLTVGDATDDTLAGAVALNVVDAPTSWLALPGMAVWGRRWGG